MGCERTNYKENIFTLKISILVLVFSSIFISSGILIANTQQKIKKSKSNEVGFNILIKSDSEIDSTQEKIKRQIIRLINKEVINSISNEKINVFPFENSINSNRKDLILSQENHFDIIINLKISKFNPHPVVETSFIMKNEKIAESLPSNSYPQPIHFDTFQSNNLRELIDFMRMIYYINNASNLFGEQRFEDKVNILSELNDEIYSAKILSMKNHFLGNFYLEEAVRLKDLPLKHDQYLDQAISHYKNSVDKNPLYSQSYFNLGYIYAVVKLDYQRAEDYFKRAVKIDANSFEYNWNLALVYIENGKNELAKKTLLYFLKNNNQSSSDSEKLTMKELLKGL